MHPELLYLTDGDVMQCISPAEAVNLAEEGIQADATGRVAGDKFYMQVGQAGFIKPFSGYMNNENLAYVKSFSYFEGNRALGLPVTDSLVTLFDAQTGLPVCIMRANWITALKTGASTAVTAKYLANPDSKRLAIFGAGGLGRMHFACLSEVFQLDEVRVYDVSSQAAELFVVEMSTITGPAVKAVDSPQAALEDCDIVVTVTTGRAENVRRSWLRPGVFIARLGSYQEVALDLLLEADKLVVDRWAYVSYRVPEMIELIQAGRLNRQNVHAEWPDIVGGRVAGRERVDEIILYIALGIWGEYAAILPYVYRQAVARGLGKRLSS